MAVVTLERECVECGQMFSVESGRRGRPQIHCDDCSPTLRRKNERKRKPQVFRSASEPFTVPHFREWASKLVLDTGELWVVEDFFCLFLEDFFAGGFPENWLLVPEGNSKTTSMSGLAVYHCEFTQYARALWAASARDQAELGYQQAEGLIERSPRLSEVFKCHPGYRRIAHRVNGSRLQIFAADDRTGDGVIPTLGLLDELHRHRNLRLYRTWRGKLGKRGGKLATFSTAGEPFSEFEVTRERIHAEATEQVRTGSHLRAVSKGVVLHEWAVAEKADVEDMAVVKAANPFSRITTETLREKFESPTTTLPHWRRFVCNLPTRAESAAIEESEWDSARSDLEIPAGTRIYAGLDLAWKWDTTALVPFWWRDHDFRLFGPANVLVPPRDGQSLDPNLVEQALLELHERTPIHTLVMDPSGAEQLAEWANKTLGCTVFERKQTNTYAVEDFARFMEGLRKGWLHHSGDADLTQHALNAVARALPGGERRFDRPVQSRRNVEQQDVRVVDALTAASMVHSTAASLETRGEAFFAWA